MWQLFQNLINFTGSSSYTSNDYYILYGCLAATLLILAWFLDVAYGIIRSFIKK